jgi:hypothetical protein
MQQAHINPYQQEQSLANNNIHSQNRDREPVNFDTSIGNTAIDLLGNTFYSLPCEGNPT